ncbi:MAG: BREX-6 system BrxE protein [Cyanobacteria bacterium J06555_13]
MILTSPSASNADAAASNRLTDSILDSILGWQFTIAWAGEGECEPRRLGWWRTDLIDEAGGGDLFQRLFPQTHEWSSLEAVRQAAIANDASIRQRLAQPDLVNTLFFWGFNVDEQLADRLAQHKRGQIAPADCLDFPVALGSEFDRGDLAVALKIPGKPVSYEVVPEGREIVEEASRSYALRAQKLAAAFLPFTERYSMPFYRVSDQSEGANGL